MKHTIADIAPHFTMKRQLDDYIRQYYEKLHARSASLNANDFELAREIAGWKKRMQKAWDQIEVLSVRIPDSTHKPMELGETFKAEITLDTHEISPEEIGIAILFGKKVNDVVTNPEMTVEMPLSRNGKKRAVYACEIGIERAGVYDFAFRVFPKHPLLPHRQDFGLLKWI